MGVDGRDAASVEGMAEAMAAKKFVQWLHRQPKIVITLGAEAENMGKDEGDLL